MINLSSNWLYAFSAELCPSINSFNLQLASRFVDPLPCIDINVPPENVYFCSRAKIHPIMLARGKMLQIEIIR